MFRVLKSGKRKKKSWKRMVTKVTFVGQGFTRKPPKYERFIRPSGEQRCCQRVVVFVNPSFISTSQRVVVFVNPSFIPTSQRVVVFVNPSFIPTSQRVVVFVNPSFMPTSQRVIVFVNPSFIPTSQRVVVSVNPSFIPTSQRVVVFVNPSFIPTSQRVVVFVNPSFIPKSACGSFCPPKLHSNSMRNMLDRHWVHGFGQDGVHSCDARASIEFRTS